MHLIGESIAAVPAVVMGEQATERQEPQKRGQDYDRAKHGFHLRGMARQQT